MKNLVNNNNKLTQVIGVITTNFRHMIEIWDT